MDATRPAGTSRYSSARARGLRAQLLAKRLLLESGWDYVEIAPSVQRRLGPPAGVVLDGPNVRMIAGPPRFITARWDYFSIWDLICVRQGQLLHGAGQRVTGFVQVTTGIDAVSPRRRKILESGFPLTAVDVIMAYVGPGLFRVYRPPDYSAVKTEAWQIKTRGKQAVVLKAEWGPEHQGAAARFEAGRRFSG